MKSIVLKFAGPLQSWGTSSHFETRRTDLHPSKSAVIGLIAGSLGWRRNDNRIEELNDLKFAIRSDQIGQLLNDYHTAHKYKSDGSPDRTYVTYRYYLEDAVFTVALASENENLIRDLYHALKYPYFQPALGRRALPPTADFIQGVFDGDPVAVLRQYPWQASERYQRRHPEIQSLEIYADSSLANNAASQMRRDHVISFSQENRRFGFRAEVHLDCPVIRKTSASNISKDDLDPEHDAFSAVGG